MSHSGKNLVSCVQEFSASINKSFILVGGIGAGSSGKWSDPGHFLKSQGKFFLSFPCTLFLHIFDI